MFTGKQLHNFPDDVRYACGEEAYRVWAEYMDLKEHIDKAVDVGRYVELDDEAVAVFKKVLKTFEIQQRQPFSYAFETLITNLGIHRKAKVGMGDALYLAFIEDGVAAAVERGVRENLAGEPLILALVADMCHDYRTNDFANIVGMAREMSGHCLSAVTALADAQTGSVSLALIEQLASQNKINVPGLAQ